METKEKFIDLPSRYIVEDEHRLEVAKEFCERLNTRRTVRDYSDKPIDLEVIKECLLTANSAPSGANQQPWFFSVVTDPEIKKEIRIQAEEEEKAFYSGRAPDEWLEALEPLGTNEDKPFLESAPCLIAIFVQKFSYDDKGNKVKHYYPIESTGIATGMLITALHNVGLCTLTHTPSPMKFLNRILGRPDNERPFLLLVTGQPAKGVKVPNIKRKSLDKIADFK